MAIDDNTSYELTGAQVKDLANKIKGKAADNTFVGATSAAPGSKGLVPEPQAGDSTKFLSGDGTWQTPPTVNNGALTIQQNGTTLDTFTANSSDDKTVNIQTITAETVAPAEEVGAITASMIDWSTIVMKGIWTTTQALSSIGASTQVTIDISSLGLRTANDYVVTVTNRMISSNSWATALVVTDRTASSFTIKLFNSHWSGGTIGAGNIIDWAVFKVA